MANLGNVSTININGNELTIKDSALTELVSEIVEAIGENNEDISQHINDLNDKAFDNLIKITSNNESEISNIQDGLYKLQYITTSGTEPNITETLINSAILIQSNDSQYRISDGDILVRTKTNNAWSNWSSVIPDDSKLVHTTGDENIGGDKTFTGVITGTDINGDLYGGVYTTWAEISHAVIVPPIDGNDGTLILGSDYDSGDAQLVVGNSQGNPEGETPEEQATGGWSQIYNAATDKTLEDELSDRGLKVIKYGYIDEEDSTHYISLEDVLIDYINYSNATYKTQKIDNDGSIIDSFIIDKYNNKFIFKEVQGFNIIDFNFIIDEYDNLNDIWNQKTYKPLQIINVNDIDNIIISGVYIIEDNFTSFTGNSSTSISSYGLLLVLRKSIRGKLSATITETAYQFLLKGSNLGDFAILYRYGSISINTVVLGNDSVENWTTWENLFEIPEVSTSVTENDDNPVSGGAVYAALEDLIGSAPAALDTLGEIAAALNNDANLASTLTTQISQKIPKVTGATAGNFAALAADGALVDSGHKHTDYITSETQADWNEGSTASPAYIKNKPTIKDNLSANYEMSSDSDDVTLEGGDAYEEAFSKIEKRINDNELVAAAALTDLDTRINGISIPIIPVTSVNGATGDVIINLALATGYAMATAINDDLFLEGGDTYEEAFSKLEKSLNDNEEIVTTALIDLDDRVSVVEDKTSDLRITASVTGYGNAVTGITASGMSLTITKGASYITTHQNIKTLNNVSLKGTGNINVVNSVNGMTGAVLIPISATVVANDANPVSGGAVYTEISTLIGGAPDALNTLGEIATALNNDADLASTLTNQITSRMPKVTGATAGNFASLAANGTLVNSGHSHNDYVTSVNGQTGTVNIRTLPAVTAADNGKILMVVNGQWEAVSPTILYSGTGIPNNANGNNGDIYIQTE